ncbi:MAG: hypothetical protein P8183_07250, partial [Anaerolineae bacterium]
MRKSIKPLLQLGLLILVFVWAVKKGYIIPGSVPPLEYDNLPQYNPDEYVSYQPISSSSFTEINTFKNIVTGRGYDKEITSIILIDQTIFIAGYIVEDNKEINRSSVDLISANIYTGKVNWQARIGDTALATDLEHIYAESITESFTPASAVAFELNGNIAWETSFDWKYAIGIESLFVLDSEIVVKTYNKGFGAFYILDKETGQIRRFVKEQDYQTLPPKYLDPYLSYDGWIFETKGEWITDLLSATNLSDGLTWQIEQPIVSNIALGGSVTYFFTKDAQLMAVDTQTGEIVGQLQFSPKLSQDFSSTNNPIVVAAHNDIVAVYFNSDYQLSVFRFTPE